ncbi:nucleotide exchange factor GrpE [Brachyspira hyodysenteriae]|uniref:Protein GrpE n=2 Tax=Brachyspira hyodysenteriae TaxID=159 RepID=GRPE_BRAHW|nr:nucleotide exchange factor GrpE [Brachyspira hyodysenteriae]C0QX60.1 RecName: Full=Protein GrpE; AltName: Full=HSP-70 cofactor [Brachyspira hyodysenteriae WA1]ACN82718.1 Protein grpE (HSP-70 cofactor) [Brachyspira hyodysenteriae WA1]ANN62654.1 nucleotide exchange factor GrpE [Brachyspira hyodysenteriae ATCC 27164]AUJ48464.1 nucleotide exchange factor GrpE [Brachyspira hyodysenteriae]KLI13083.1 molecular chaperone GrpE [Brachyspira hyodysenteriae]KLI15322.1 molecular chaperone GrpE [Brachys
MEEEIKETSEDKEEENTEAEAVENNEKSEENAGNVEEDEITALKKRIEELENESADMKNKYMYAMAEAENIRKRTAKEKADSIKRANKGLLLSLLTFMDNFERALKAGEQDSNVQGSEYYKGIELIHKQFIDFMHDNGVSEIESLGEEFDPNVHEALTMIEVPDIDKEKVVEVYAKGYKLNDELLRTAKVVVGKPAAAKE